MTKRKNLQLIILITLFFLVPNIILAEEIRDIEFPVAGPHTLTDSFGDPRSGGRSHEGVDILADKMTPLVSAVDGTVSFITMEERDWGFGVFITDADKYSYRYLHINNDTPGTDDGQGGALYAFPATISRGAKVVRGQLIGWVGDSGNAENTVSHLHFEIRQPNGTAINPFPSLTLATVAGSFDPEKIKLLVPNINEDKNLNIQDPSTLCNSGALVKTANLDAVYYCGADGKRYVFPSAQTYLSWYDNFSKVETITELQLSNLPIGGNVTYRPGKRMIKIQTDPKTYVVDKGGVLRWVTTPEIAESMYGNKWSEFIDDISPAFFVNYKIGEPITAALL